MRINVHAGHNPPHMIACGAVGILDESYEDRQVKNRVISQLQSLGHTVYDCTCDNGTSQGDVLYKIVQKCNSHTVDLDVSIHFNAGGGQGVETLVYSLGSSSPVSTAQSIVNSIAELGFKNRGVKVRPDLYVLSQTKAPAVLIECCFVDSQSDANLYNADAMASAIVKGITGQSGNVTPVPTPVNPTPAASTPDVYYSVRTTRVLPEVKNDTDYAGIPGQIIKDLAVRLTSGSVSYRVHTLNGRWLPWVTGCDWNDANNGYAGMNKAIDAIQIKTGNDVNGSIKYRVAPINGNYYSWVTEDSDYAGWFGKAIDRIQIKF